MKVYIYKSDTGGYLVTDAPWPGRGRLKWRQTKWGAKLCAKKMSKTKPPSGPTLLETVE